LICEEGALYKRRKVTPTEDFPIRHSYGEQDGSSSEIDKK
jgi:hypothetical protein